MVALVQVVPDVEGLPLEVVVVIVVPVVVVGLGFFVVVGQGSLVVVGLGPSVVVVVGRGLGGRGLLVGGGKGFVPVICQE